MFTLDDLDRAEAIVYAHLPPTPQYAWPLLAEELGTEVWVKHENHTPTGAFKVRGGLIHLDRLRHRSDIAGIIARPRQPRSEPGVRRAGDGCAGRDRGAARQQRREERRHASLRCRVDRERPRFPGCARGSGTNRGGARVGDGAVVPSRPRRGRRDLRGSCSSEHPRSTPSTYPSVSAPVSAA